MVVSPSFARFQKNTHCKPFFFLSALGNCVSFYLQQPEFLPAFLVVSAGCKNVVLGRRKTIRSSLMNHTFQQQLIIAHAMIKCV